MVFLPSGATKAEPAARKSFDKRIPNPRDRANIRVLYLGEDGKIYQLVRVGKNNANLQTHGRQIAALVEGVEVVPFDTYAVAKPNPSWETLEENPAEEVLRTAERNPCAPLARTYIDERYNFVPFDHEKVLSELTKPMGDEGLVGVRLGSGETPVSLECTISRTAFGSFVQIGIDSEDLPKIGDLEKVKKYLEDWRFVLPAFSHSGADADDRDNDFWIDVAQIGPLPKCVGSGLGWYHVMSPLGYKDYFKREDLLATPALKVEELDDGTITVLSYEHPLDFATEATTKRIIEITNYLNKVRVDASPFL